MSANGDWFKVLKSPKQTGCIYSAFTLICTILCFSSWRPPSPCCLAVVRNRKMEIVALWDSNHCFRS